MLTYLGGAIDYANEAQKNWREEISKRLLEHNISSYNPATAFNVTNKHLDSRLINQLKNINDMAIMKSDVAVFWLPKSVLSVGSVVELVELVGSTNNKTHIVVVCPDVYKFSDVSFYLYGLLTQHPKSNLIVGIKQDNNTELLYDIVSDAVQDIVKSTDTPSSPLNVAINMLSPNK